MTVKARYNYTYANENKKVKLKKFQIVLKNTQTFISMLKKIIRKSKYNKSK